MLKLLFDSPGMLFLVASTIVVHVFAFVWVRRKIRAAIQRDAEAEAASEPPPPE